MGKPRRYFEIMNLDSPKPHDLPVDEGVLNVDKSRLAELERELYPPFPGYEWFADFDDTAAARFYAKLAPIDPLSGCIEWTSARTNGYGMFSLGGKPVFAHRVAMLDAGRWPPAESSERYVAHHRCENPGCVNPYHCEWLTDTEHRAVHRELLEGW